MSTTKVDIHVPIGSACWQAACEACNRRYGLLDAADAPDQFHPTFCVYCGARAIFARVEVKPL